MAIDLYKNRCDVYEGEKPYVFISYSHKDIERVVSMIRKLQSLGFRIWYDSGVPAGTEWREEIAAKLKNSKCVLSLLSENSARSRHFKVEFNYAYHLELPILVAYLDDCVPTPGVEMLVVSQQCIKREHCEDDEDLLEEIARAKILLPCLGEKPNNKPETAEPIPEPTPKAESKTPKTKLEQLREMAEKGDAQAQFNLGWTYDQGNGVEQNYSEAVKWFRKSADQEHRNAQYNLGVYYEYGHGVSQSYEEAFKWYQKAAKHGYTSAQLNLGVLYDLGRGVAQNPVEAVNWYRKAADKGNRKAQWNLGICYENGDGVAQDWDEATRWYRKAAEQGHAKAQKQMASCYRKGLGVPIDEAEADRWQKLYDENPDK